MHGKVIFHEAARDGDTATVRKMLSTAGAQSLINYQDASGATPLYIAAHNGHASVTKQLIEARCDIELQQNVGYTPLCIAATMGIRLSSSTCLKLAATLTFRRRMVPRRSTSRRKKGMRTSCST